MEHVLKVIDHNSDVSLSYYSSTWDVLAFTGEDEDTACTIVASFRTRDDAQSYVRRADADRTVAAWGHVTRPPSTMLGDGLGWLTFVLHARYTDGVNVTRYPATI